MRQRSPGAWSLVLYLGRDASGRKRQKWITFRGNKRAAERELTRLVNEIHSGTWVEPSRETYGEYLDRWMTQYVEPNLSHQSQRKYSIHIEQQIRPRLGHLRLSSIQPMHIQEFVTWCYREGRADRAGGLHPNSVNQILTVVKMSLEQAVAWQIIRRNPAEHVKPLRYEAEEVRVLSRAESDLLLAAAEDHELEVAIILAMGAGLRRGEVLGLRWQDIDPEKALLHVRHSVEEFQGQPRLKETKTAAGRRSITISETLLAALERQRRRLDARGLTACDIVLPAPTGRLLLPRAVTSGFKRLVEQLRLRHPEFPQATFHDLRHLNATHLLAARVPAHVVQKRLGHRRIETTLGTYAHVMPAQDQAAAAVAETAIFGEAD